jgi:hypothetical protein
MKGNTVFKENRVALCPQKVYNISAKLKKQGDNEL